MYRIGRRQGSALVRGCGATGGILPFKRRNSNLEP